jgi:hypothetical protein
MDKNYEILVKVLDENNKMEIGKAFSKSFSIKNIGSDW